MPAEVLYRGDDVVDDVDFVQSSGHLYWSSEFEGCIKRAPIHDMSRVVNVLCDLDHPRAVAVANVFG